MLVFCLLYIRLTADTHMPNCDAYYGTSMCYCINVVGSTSCHNLLVLLQFLHFYGWYVFWQKNKVFGFLMNAL